ncbi:hypothetical protein ACWKWC_04605 [Geodermatophilus nigrescens]
MRVRPRGTASRLVLGLADSAVSSVGNLGASVLAAHVATLVGFGIFATAMLVLILATMAARSLHGEVLVLRSRSGVVTASDARDSTSSVLVLSGGIGLVVAGVAVAVGLASGFGEGVLTVAVAGLALPLLCVQDHLRWIEYARGTSHHALANDVLWTVAAIGGLAVLGAAADGDVSAPVCLAVWAGATVPGILYGLRSSGVALTASGRARWLAPNRGLAAPLFMDFSLTQATAQGATLVIAALAGPLEMAAIRKGQIWLGAAAVATTGLLAALQPLLAQRAASRGPGPAIRFATVLGLAGSVLLVLYGLAVVLLPDGVARLLVGEGWDSARPFVWPLAVQSAAGLLGGCWGLSLRVTGRLRAQVRWRTVLGPAAVVAVAVATSAGGAVVGAWALAAAAVGTTLVWGLLLAVPGRDGGGHVAVAD